MSKYVRRGVAKELNTEEIIKLYTIEFLSIKNISKKFNCRDVKIRQLLLDNNITLNKKGDSKTLKILREKNITSKKCIECLLEKNIEDFPFNGKTRRNHCKKCCNKIKQELKNGIHRIKKKKEKSPRVLQTKEERLIVLREWYANKRKNNISFKLKRNTSTAIYKILKQNKNGKSILKYLDYSIEELKQHLESQFEPWMAWENWGKYDPKTHDQNPTWNIDHIIPISHLPFSSMEDENFKKCWALSNLRPLNSKINVYEKNNR